MRIFQILLVLVLINGAMVYAWEQPPANVVVSKIVFQKQAQNRSFIGTLFYDRISHVSSEVSGLVKNISVRVGDRVKKGKVLVTLDIEMLEKEISFHRNQIKQAALRIMHSKKNYQRMNSLYKTGGIREKDYDDAGFVYKEALLKKLSAQTILDKLMIQKGKSVITSPFEGIVLEKNVDSGDWVQQGKQIASIGSVNDLFIKVPVAETLLKFISSGDKVPVIINAYNRELIGTIDNLSPIADAKTKNVVIKVRIPMLTRVAQNMSANVFISTGSKQNLAVIPRDALFKFQGKDFVYTVKEKKAVQLPVNIVAYLGNSIGADDEHFTEGMPVIVEGNERLRPDQSIVIIRDN